MQAKNNLTLNDQSLDSFPQKQNEEGLKTTQKVPGIKLIEKYSDENLDDEPKSSKLENNEEEEEFNYLLTDNEDNFPFPSEDDGEDNSASSEKNDKIANYCDDIRQNDEQKDQRFLDRKTARKKSDDYSSVEKTKKNFSENSF